MRFGLLDHGGMKSAWALLEASAVVCAFAGLGGLLFLHGVMMTTNAPMEMRDGAMLSGVLALMDGRNPYALSGLMETGNVYGIGYPLIVLPFAWLFGASFSTLHFVSGLAMAGASVLVYGWLCGAGVRRLDAALGAGLVYAGLIYYTGAVARPDGVGTFLMLASVEVMRRGDLRPRAFAWGTALAMAGLSCKLYYVWPAFAAATYVFFWRDWRRGLAYGLTAVGATAASLAAMAVLLPGYVAFVLVANLGATEYVASYLLKQSFDWLIFDLPLAAALIVLLARRGWGREGFSLRRDPGFLNAMAGLGAIAIVGKLGGHPGAHLSYIFQLLSPFAAVWILSLAARDRPALYAFRVALPVMIALNAHWFPLDPDRFRTAAQDFANARALIDNSRQVLATTEFAGLLALEGKPLVETGHAAYLENALDRATPDWLKPWLSPAAALDREWRRVYCGARAKVDAAAYDVAIIGALPTVLIPINRLRRDYHVTRRFTIDMPWSLQSWPVEVWRARDPAPVAAPRGDPCEPIPAPV